MIKLGQQGSGIARYNFFVAAILVLAAVSWPYVQKATDWYYQREAKAFFKVIEEKEIQYSLKNNRYLSFEMQKNAKQLKELDLNLNKAKYYDYAVIEIDTETFHIIAQLRPKIIKKWLLNGPNTKLALVYEKKVGKEGRILN